MANVSAEYSVHIRYDGGLSGRELHEFIEDKLKYLPGLYDVDIRYFSVNGEECNPYDEIEDEDEEEDENISSKCPYGLECACKDCFYPDCNKR